MCGCLLANLTVKQSLGTAKGQRNGEFHQVRKF